MENSEMEATKSKTKFRAAEWKELGEIMVDIADVDDDGYQRMEEGEGKLEEDIRLNFIKKCLKILRYP